MLCRNADFEAIGGGALFEAEREQVLSIPFVVVCLTLAIRN